MMLLPSCSVLHHSIADSVVADRLGNRVECTSAHQTERVLSKAYLPAPASMSMSRTEKRRSSCLESDWWRAKISRVVSLRLTNHRKSCTRCEIGGQYDETFSDVEKHMLNCFTVKAVRSILGQLQETNPPQYLFFYNFVVDNRPQDGKLFLQTLLKERQELGERVMVMRLHLFNTWIKNYSHADLYKAISDQNLELLRERLVQTVKFADVEDSEKPQPPPPAA